jgi:hypothetical protein
MKKEMKRKEKKNKRKNIQEILVSTHSLSSSKNPNNRMYA